MKNLDAAYSALADPTRRAIVARLAQGEATVGEIAKPFPISGPAISRHLKVLEQAERVPRTPRHLKGGDEPELTAPPRRGKQLVCRINPKGLKSARDWLEEMRAFWE